MAPSTRNSPSRRPCAGSVKPGVTLARPPATAPDGAQRKSDDRGTGIEQRGSDDHRHQQDQEHPPPGSSSASASAATTDGATMPAATATCPRLGRSRDGSLTRGGRTNLRAGWVGITGPVCGTRSTGDRRIGARPAAPAPSARGCRILCATAQRRAPNRPFGRCRRSGPRPTLAAASLFVPPIRFRPVVPPDGPALAQCLKSEEQPCLIVASRRHP